MMRLSDKVLFFICGVLIPLIAVGIALRIFQLLGLVR